MHSLCICLSVASYYDDYFAGVCGFDLVYIRPVSVICKAKAAVDILIYFELCVRNHASIVSKRDLRLKFSTIFSVLALSRQLNMEVKI